MSVYEKLMHVQSELKAPKSQFNGFGKYNYRNCEDILEALKPICSKHNTVTYLTDDVAVIGQRTYVKATAIFVDVETSEKIENTAFAREEENKKGMDGSQVTGASSSYARKYALNGLFGIDDTKDSDTTNTGDKHKNESSEKSKNELSDKQITRLYAIAHSKGCDKDKVDKGIATRYKKQVKDLTKEEYDFVCNGYESM